MFFHRLRQALHVRREQLQTFRQGPVSFRQALHVRCEQLQTFSQGAVSFGQPIKAFVSSHSHILRLFPRKKVGFRKASTPDRVCFQTST